MKTDFGDPDSTDTVWVVKNGRAAEDLRQRNAEFLAAKAAFSPPTLPPEHFATRGRWGQSDLIPIPPSPKLTFAEREQARLAIAQERLAEMNRAKAQRRSITQGAPA